MNFKYMYMCIASYIDNNHNTLKKTCKQILIFKIPNCSGARYGYFCILVAIIVAILDLSKPSTLKSIYNPNNRIP